MTYPADNRPKLDVMHVIADGVRNLGRDLSGTTLPAFVAVLMVMSLFNTVLERILYPGWAALPPEDMTPLLPSLVLSGLIVWLVNNATILPFLLALVARRRGIAITYLQAVPGSLTVLPAFLAVTFLLVLAVGIASVFLVVPGLIVACVFAVVQVVCAVERPGILPAFHAAEALSRGNRWQIFAVMVLVFAAALALSFVVDGILGRFLWSGLITAALAPEASFVTLFLGNVFYNVSTVILGIFYMSVYVSMYEQLSAAARSASPPTRADAFS